MSNTNGNDRTVNIQGGVTARRKAVLYVSRNDGIEVLNPEAAADAPILLRDSYGGVCELREKEWRMREAGTVLSLDALPIVAEDVGGGLANGNGNGALSAPVSAEETPGRLTVVLGETSETSIAPDASEGEGDSLVSAAVELGKLGYRVFPVRPKAKRPYESGWQESASTDADRIRAAWTVHPRARIGIAPDGFTVIDVDPRNGGTEPAGLPQDAPRARTGGGGLHVYVRGDLRANLGPGIDLKRAGGFVVAPPSPRTYTWLTGPLPVSELPEVVGLAEAAPAAEVDQDALRAPSLEALRACVATIPNDVPDRDGYVRMGHAIRAAGGPEAVEAWRDWCARWTEGENDPAVVERDWEGFRGPYRLGWEWLQVQVRVAPGDVFEAVESGEVESGEVESAGESTGADSDRAKRLLKNVKTLSKIKRRKVKWLWPGRLALHELNMLYGDGDVGKSMLWCKIAADVSRGRLGNPPADVLIITAEDDAESIIEPRIAAADGDMERIHVVAMGGSLPGCVDDMAFYIRHFSAALVIIDPITSYLAGDKDSHKDADVRSALRPLQNAIRAAGAAVLFSIHLNKRESNKDTSRIIGSVAFRNLVRSAIGVAVDPTDGTDETRDRVLFQSKLNIGRKAPTLRFAIVDKEIDYGEDGRGTIGTIEWGEECDITAAQALAGRAGDGKRSAEDRAHDFMSQVLDELRDVGADKIKVQQLHERARLGGFTSTHDKRAVGSAIRAVFGKTKPDGVGGAWIVSISPRPEPAEAPEDPDEWAGTE